jgi:hypothetical protein
MTYDEIANYIFLDVPGCQQFIIDQQLKRACRDFCYETEAWVDKLDAIDLVADQTEYRLLPRWNGSVHRVLSVALNETDGDYDSGIIDLNNYYVQDEDTLVLNTTPTSSVTDGMKVKVCLVPPLDGTIDFPDWFLDRWGEGLISKAKFNLMSMPRKPWSDPASAALHGDIYRQRRSEALFEKVKDRRDGVVRMTIPFYA